jgi:UDP-N-acetylmuramyl pentapeptide synthase
MARDQRLAALRARVLQEAVTLTGEGPRCVLFFSFTDGGARATTRHFTGADAASCWAAAAPVLAAEPDERLAWLRVDWVRAREATDWGRLKARLADTKRNYFRLGIALDAGFDWPFLETEINANAMLYCGPGHPVAELNEARFRQYARARHDIAGIDFSDDVPLWLFSTAGLFMDEDGAIHAITQTGRNAGRRTIATLEPELLTQVIDSGSRYLAGQVQDSGRFHYGWHPCFDREIPAYNSLRHASTTYAMLEAWELTRDPALFAAIERALAYLTQELIQPATLPDGREAAFLIDPGGEIKLGGNAVCLLALVKHDELTGDMRHRPLMERLAAGILHMQGEDGCFVHVLQWPDLSVKQPFRIIYYDGEAAFGLMRLYGLTGDPRWIAAVERAFDHFIAAGHASAHDHWLGYCANEMTRHRPEERYFRFGLDNVRGYLDFVSDRITTFPTLLELMTAAERMIARIADDPAQWPLLDTIDLDHFYAAMHKRAAYLMNGHFWPELAMFFAKPARVAGSFFIRHHAFRVRIDDVEHYLSGLIAYRAYLLSGRAERQPTATGWTAHVVQRATGGRWITPPPEGWTASGLSAWQPSLQPGDMAVLRGAPDERGIPPKRLPGLSPRPAAILTSAPDALPPTDLPVLAVPHTDDAILALGRHARAAMTGKLIGVTGSAGKTTMVAMLAQTLGAWGPVGQTRMNANLPHGIAWNLASMPWDTPHIVLEMAIGRMRQNALLARPDIALFTNIAPAHLEYHRDLSTVARRKAAIFEGMGPGSVAILNADMAECDRVRAMALERDLRVILYGENASADFRLIDHIGAAVTAHTPAGEMRYALAAPGRHMAMNSVAILATLSALALEPASGLARLADFRPLAGRGEEAALTLDGRRITLIDEAYNANPASMAAAIALLGARADGRRVAVLGEMLELGPDAATYHAALAPLIAMHRIDCVHAVGALYDGLWDALPADRRGIRADDVDQLHAALRATLRDGDILLVKGSHGGGLHILVDRWKAEAQMAQAA